MGKKIKTDYAAGRERAKIFIERAQRPGMRFTDPETGEKFGIDTWAGQKLYDQQRAKAQKTCYDYATNPNIEKTDEGHLLTPELREYYRGMSDVLKVEKRYRYNVPDPYDAQKIRDEYERSQQASRDINYGFDDLRFQRDMQIIKKNTSAEDVERAKSDVARMREEARAADEYYGNSTSEDAHEYRVRRKAREMDGLTDQIQGVLTRISAKESRWNLTLVDFIKVRDYLKAERGDVVSFSEEDEQYRREQGYLFVSEFEYFEGIYAKLKTQGVDIDRYISELDDVISRGILEEKERSEASLEGAKTNKSYKVKWKSVYDVRRLRQFVSYARRNYNFNELEKVLAFLQNEREHFVLVHEGYEGYDYLLDSDSDWFNGKFNRLTKQREGIDFHIAELEEIIERGEFTKKDKQRLQKLVKYMNERKTALYGYVSYTEKQERDEYSDWMRESPGNPAVSTFEVKTEPIETVSTEMPKKGKKLKHKTFGIGEVVDRDVLGYVTIEFEDGVRRFKYADAVSRGFLEDFDSVKK